MLFVEDDNAVRSTIRKDLHDNENAVEETLCTEGAMGFLNTPSMCISF